MKRKKILMAGIIVLLVAAVLTLNISNVFAAINEDYYNQISEGMEVDNSSVERSAITDILLNAVAQLIYTVGSLLERILGYLFETMSGDNIFPWADAILFNAVPILDINVFNPSKASMIIDLSSVIYNIYWTIFALALSFFGIAIMVTAIKLVVSTVASEKAAYKQAVVKWLTAFIMLWGIHFFMSFAIYLNEQLVIVAQKIATNSIGNEIINIRQLVDTDQRDYEVVLDFIECMTEDPPFSVWGAIKYFALTIAALAITVAAAFLAGVTLPAWGTIIAVGLAVGTGSAIAGGNIEPRVVSVYTSVRYKMDENITESLSKEEACEILLNNTFIAAELLKNPEYADILERRVQVELVGDSEEDVTWKKTSSEKALELVAFDTNAIAAKASNSAQKIKIKVNDGPEEEVSYIEYLKAYIGLADSLPASDCIIKTPLSDSMTKATITYYALDKNQNKVVEKICSTEGDNVCGSDNLVLLDGAAGNPKDYVNHDITYYDHAKIISDAYDSFDADKRVFSSSNRDDDKNLISNLATTFKKMAWSGTGWKPSRVTIENALLYAILVAQSLIFFIAYVKRLFYIIILILMAPIVVVYDFFAKFSS